MDHLLILKPVRFLEGELIHDVSLQQVFFLIHFNCLLLNRIYVFHNGNKRDADIAFPTPLFISFF